MVDLIRGWMKPVSDRADRKISYKEIGKFVIPSRPYVLLALDAHLAHQLAAVLKLVHVETRVATTLASSTYMLAQATPTLIITSLMESGFGIELIRKLTGNKFDLVTTVFVVPASYNKHANTGESSTRYWVNFPVDPLQIIKIAMGIPELHQ